jgi:hypothetical protein
MAENKVRGARFTPDIQEKIEAYESVFGWDFGQTVTQLFNYRERLIKAVRGFEVVRCSDGSIELIHHDAMEPGMPVLNQAVIAQWLIQELQKSIAEGFREPLFDSNEEKEEVS